MTISASGDLPPPSSWQKVDYFPRKGRRPPLETHTMNGEPFARIRDVLWYLREQYFDEYGACNAGLYVNVSMIPSEFIQRASYSSSDKDEFEKDLEMEVWARLNGANDFTRIPASEFAQDPHIFHPYNKERAFELIPPGCLIMQDSQMITTNGEKSNIYDDMCINHFSVVEWENDIQRKMLVRFGEFLKTYKPLVNSESVLLLDLVSHVHSQQSHSGIDEYDWKIAVDVVLKEVKLGKIQIFGSKFNQAPEEISKYLLARAQVVYPSDPWSIWVHLIGSGVLVVFTNSFHFNSDEGAVSYCDLFVLASDALLIWPHVEDKSGGQSFRDADDVIVEKMRAAIQSGVVSSASSAAWMFVGEAKRNGSDESTHERLRKRYGAKYPSRRRNRS
jgi:hypothetical protein